MMRAEPAGGHGVCTPRKGVMLGQSGRLFVVGRRESLLRVNDSPFTHFWSIGAAVAHFHDAEGVTGSIPVWTTGKQKTRLFGLLVCCSEWQDG